MSKCDERALDAVVRVSSTLTTQPAQAAEAKTDPQQARSPFLCRSGHPSLQILIQRGQEVLGGLPLLVRSDQQPVPPYLFREAWATKRAGVENPHYHSGEVLDAIMADAENADTVAFLVTLPEPADRTVRVNITLPERLLRRIDARAKNRSAFLARAAEKALAES